jgi:hypothetical protein
MGLMDTLKNLVSKNTSTVDSAIDDLGNVVDEKTGNKYKSELDSVQGFATKEVDSTAPQPPATPTTS